MGFLRQLIALALVAFPVTALLGPDVRADTSPSLFRNWQKILDERRLPPAPQSVELHPFSYAPSSHQPPLLRLHRSGMIDFEQTMVELLRSSTLHPMIGIRGQDAPRQYRSAPRGRNSNAEARKFHFYVGNHPICHHSVTAVQIANAHTPLMLGDLPEVSMVFDGSTKWPRQSATVSRLSSYLSEVGMDAKNLSPQDFKACYYLKQGELFPAWDFVGMVEMLPYQFTADESEVFQVRKRYFDVTGLGKAYRTNPYDETINTYDIKNLTGDGTLTTKQFYTDPYGQERIESSNHDFRLEPSHQSFTEVNAFIHLQRQYDWFTSLGFDYGDEAPMRVRVHAMIQNDPNNAVYLPGTSLAPPAIFIGDGSNPSDANALLINLGLDEDVISHEFAHHVIYQNITETSKTSESLVLHEGLADYFTHARTGNTCLGESICPVGSPICTVDGQCLRSADNELRLNSIDLPIDAHGRSQLISAMMWQMQEHPHIPAEFFHQIAYRAVTLMVSNSGYRHLIIGLLAADRELFDGEYGCYIQDIAHERGMHLVMQGIDCEADALPDISLNSAIEGASSPASSTNVSHGGSSGSNDLFSCGVVANSAHSKSLMLLMLALLPLFILTYNYIHRTMDGQSDARKFVRQGK